MQTQFERLELPILELSIGKSIHSSMGERCLSKHLKNVSGFCDTFVTFSLSVTKKCKIQMKNDTDKSTTNANTLRKTQIETECQRAKLARG